jgi:hypothetical protein
MTLFLIAALGGFIGGATAIGAFCYAMVRT